MPEKAIPREIKALPLEISELKETTTAGVRVGQFTGNASTFNNVDLGNDRIMAGAFARTVAHHKGKFPILWHHDPWAPIGVSVDAKETNRALTINAEINLDVQRGAEAYALLKQEAISGLSIGYRARKAREVVESGEVIRELSEIELMEISLVTFPMNQRATVTDVKSEDVARILKELETLRPDLSAELLQKFQSEVQEALQHQAPGNAHAGGGPADPRQQDPPDIGALCKAIANFRTDLARA